MTNFNLKYLKYKKKYINLKEQIGGSSKIISKDNFNELLNQDIRMNTNTVKTIYNYLRQDTVMENLKNIILKEFKNNKDREYYLKSLNFFYENKLPPLIFLQSFKQQPDSIIKYIISNVPMAVKEKKIIIIGKPSKDSVEILSDAKKEAFKVREAAKIVKNAKNDAENAVKLALKGSKTISQQLSKAEEVAVLAEKNAEHYEINKIHNEKVQLLQKQIDALNRKFIEEKEKEKDKEKKEDEEEEKKEEILLMAEDIAEDIAVDTAEDIATDVATKEATKKAEEIIDESSESESEEDS